MLRYWTGEAWTDEVRPSRPPLPATGVEEDWLRDEDASRPRNVRSGLRVLPEHPSGAEVQVESPVPETDVAGDPWQSWAAVEELRLAPPAPPQEAGAATPKAAEAAPRLLWEFAKFALVALFAVVAGALVAGVGIALTV